MILTAGTIIKGFCNGYFGRDSYTDKIVEGIGTDWIVVREVSIGTVLLATFESRAEMIEMLEQWERDES